MLIQNRPFRVYTRSQTGTEPIDIPRTQKSRDLCETGQRKYTYKDSTQSEEAISGLQDDQPRLLST